MTGMWYLLVDDLCTYVYITFHTLVLHPYWCCMRSFHLLKHFKSSLSLANSIVYLLQEYLKKLESQGHVHLNNFITCVKNKYF